ncbi:MAG: hypothetical protein RQ723_08610 [Desulfuromonadales bacterium]|nr:hypothetical protein [Desulfuromonadales bacterium]
MPDLTQKLRIGLLLDSETVPAWQQLALRKIVESSSAELVLAVINGSPKGGETAPFPYRAYRWLDRKLFKATPDAFARAPLSDLLGNVERLVVTPRQTRYSDDFPADAIDQLRARNLDVLIRFGFRILRGDILTAARLGVWSYHHGDNDRYRGGPPGFWEVMEAAPATGCVLQILNEDLDNGTVIYKSFSLTDKLSVHRNKSRLYWKSASFLVRCLAEAQRLGPERYLEQVRQQQPAISVYGWPMYTPAKLSWPRMLSFVAGLAWRNLQRKLGEALWREQWILLYRFRTGRALSFWRFRQLTPPADRFWADPHVICRDGRHYLFFEEFLYRSGKGRIVCVRFDDEGRPTPPEVVLERDTHLSYPHLFEHAGEVYMVPESSQNRTVELYRAVDFPSRWELVKVLLDNVTAVDATLLQHDGRWWLFANLVETPGASSCDELFLYSTTDVLTGDWEPHPANPIVSDVRCARPAGCIFAREGVLYRPAQNCSGRYGNGIVLQRIDRLTLDEYAETSVDSFDASFMAGIGFMHTFNQAGELTVADARRKRWKWC